MFIYTDKEIIECDSININTVSISYHFEGYWGSVIFEDVLQIMDKKEKSIDTSLLVVGSVLIAIDECRFVENRNPSLTIGNEYQIDEVLEYGANAGCIKIMNDLSDEHLFRKNSIDKYFTLKP